MWTKVLFDLGLIGFDEPYKKLLNQGMIQGSSRFVYRVDSVGHLNLNGLDFSLFISNGIAQKCKNDNNYAIDLINRILFDEIKNFTGTRFLKDDKVIITQLHTDVKFVDGVELDIDVFRNWKPEYKDAIIICEDGEVSFPLSLGEGLGVRSNGKYICGVETEKMSKSKYNTVNPDELCEKYGADTFRMYEMFLGPVEASKPWDTKGIEGVHRFLRKLWRLFFDEQKGPIWTSSAPSPLERAGGEVTDAEFKILHRTIKKIEEDTERFSFNTAVSTFMICVNELADAKCHKKEVLEKLLILLTPYAPHIAAELWDKLGNDGSVLDSAFPAFDGKYLVESSKEYPISVNGKLRTNINIALDASPEEVEKIVQANEVIQKWLDGKPPKKIIFVKGKMVNVVI
jgi:leucyl-tRNA synthetase